MLPLCFERAFFCVGFIGGRALAGADVKRIALHSAGALTFGVWGWLAFVSRGNVSLPILFCTVGAAWALLGGAWRCSRKMGAAQVLRAAWIWGVLFRVAGFFGEPVLEDDWARYLWDGRMLATTGNPYASAPAKHFNDESVPESFQRVLDEINSPDVPTIYAPVCEYAFAASHLIAPAKLWPWKLMLLVADLLALALLLRMVPPRHALLYAWCPLLIQETAFTAHPDSLWVFFLVAALHDFSKGKHARMAVCCGLALATKIFALLIVPFLLVRAAWKYRLLSLAVFAAAYLPFWLQGSAADFAGLRAMSGDWEFNSTIFAGLAHFVGAGAAKLITLATFATIWGTLLWRWMRANRSATELPRGDLIFGCFFLLSAVVNPWYLLALLPFVVLRPSAWGVGALAVVTLSYAHGLYASEPSLAPYELPGWVRSLELSAVALLLFVGRRWAHIGAVPAERN